jgi:hypothetical protein
MREKFSTYFNLFLFIVLVAAFVWGASPVDAEEPGTSWCYPRCLPPTATPTATQTPTPTSTPTNTPVPELQACQVTDVIFDQESYLVGDSMNVTVRVVDGNGAPLVGANVVAQVTREELQVQAVATVDLEDRSGDYDGVYSNTSNPGLYTFNFSVSDPTGQRFAPCSSSTQVEVTEIPPAPVCEISLRTNNTEISYGQAITATAIVSVSGQAVSSAQVSGTVTRPDSSQEALAFTGAGPFTAAYTNTTLAGSYLFSATASDPDEQFESCTVSEPLTVTVVDTRPMCTLSLEFDGDSYETGDPIGFSAVVTNTNNAAAQLTGEVTLPGGGSESLSLTGNGVTFTGTVTNTVAAGSYLFSLAATDPTGLEFVGCEISESVEVTEPVLPPTIVMLPERLDTTLCSLRETTTVKVQNAVGIMGVSLQMSYDPGIIQVIDGDGSKPGVQVRFNPTFATGAISRNEVDTSRGEIFFEANLLNGGGLNGMQDLIAIDWRPQQVGNSAITIESLTLIDAEGQTINSPVLTSLVTVAFVPNCLTGTVALEGRGDHSGVIVTNSDGVQTTTMPDGSFGLPASEQLVFERGGFVTALADVSQILAAAAEGQPVTIQTVTLLVGDVNGDNIINILDMAFLAHYYSTNNPIADLNQDGRVDIMDLALCANNYQKQGPIINSQ